MTDAIGLRLNEPYLHGLLLATNAIPNARLLVDGPGSVAVKARRIVGPHDLRSTLLDCAGEDRVVCSGIDANRMADGEESSLIDPLKRLAADATAGVVLVTAMPMTSVADTDDGRSLGQAAPEGGAPIVDVGHRALADDWLTGYEAALAALAQGMDLSGRRGSADHVAVIGYLMDRNEGDHRGNVAALRRMLRALGLEPTSIWLSGASYEELRDVRHAETIVSLPHGRRAARILAERLGAELVETDLPFGLDGTTRWMKQVAAATGREAQATAYVDGELDRIVPRLEWVVPQIFLGRRFVFIGDPHYGKRFVELIGELGGSVPDLVVTADDSHLSEPEYAALAERTHLRHQPDLLALRTWWQAQDPTQIDMLVSSSFAAEVVEVESPWLEWGYPSHYTHFLTDEPFLGFEGCLSFINRVANAMTQQSAFFRARDGV
ncbi:MAG: hypothetical protein JRI23_11110 [Deltaproteobacteria bacterium]|jgi:nitrogenase molybdenum-iron protein alpha/beta subunit|nr:hypothetical protein [Deltaproteobacteria bacterium]MBW2532231.1 hypothetical protein [Deltaproteobacteria bacterium]